MKIGIVDLDTSHPANWVPILHDHQLDIVAVHDGGLIHTEKYVEEFAQSYRIPTICKRLEDMVPLVDGAIIHCCDWDRHLIKAEPFLAAGKAVLIDKPIAGNFRDLKTLIDWEENRGARITGGSSLRYAVECMEFLARPTDERGDVHTIFGGCSVDDFNYGIHAYSLVCGLMGPGLQAVRHLRGEKQNRIELQWSGGRSAYIAVGKLDAWIPFYATVVATKSVTPIVIDSTKLYRSLLDAVLSYFAGNTSFHLPLRTLVEPELAALAALKSQNLGGVLIPLTDLAIGAPSYHGETYATGYRVSRCGPQAIQASPHGRSVIQKQ